MQKTRGAREVSDSVRDHALSPASRAQSIFLFRDPGACAPGFMLPSASRTRSMTRLQLFADSEHDAITVIRGLGA